MSHILSIDIEHSGFNLIAIGAIVVDTKGNQIHEFFATCYDEETTRFSERCWKEFWSKEQQALDNLKHCPQKMSSVSELVDWFHQWYTDVWYNDMIMVSDNPGFDIGELNGELKALGKPGLFYDQANVWHPIVDVYSLQQGIILSKNDGDCPQWNRSQFIREHYGSETKLPLIEHDHHPVNDAHSIAVDYLLCMELMDGGSDNTFEVVENLFAQEYYKPYQSFFEYIKEFPWDDEFFRQGSYTIKPAEHNLSHDIDGEDIVVKVSGVPIESLDSYQRWKTQVQKLK